MTNRKIFRARGVYEGTGRDSWLTTVWRNNRAEAESDIMGYGNRHKNTRIIEHDYDEFLKKHQRLPRF